MMTLGADLAPPRHRNEFLSIWRLIGDVGSAGGPLAVGRLAGLVSLSAASEIIGGVGLLAAGIFALAVPETLHRSKGARR